MSRTTIQIHRFDATKDKPKEHYSANIEEGGGQTPPSAIHIDHPWFIIYL